MYRTLIIVRHTFREAIVQPIYTLLIALGAAILFIFAMLPFFTLGEDTVMFKDVGLDVVLLLVLVATLFATSKSIFEEIEDRTMLTLMSKPVQKWEVMLGKYLGIVLAALLAVAILGTILILCTWWRIPGDNMMRTMTLDERELGRIWEMRKMHAAGLLPSLLLMWFQISVLAAIGVALSTRFPLVVNLPIVIIIYIAGNLTRFIFPMDAPGSPLEGRPIMQAFAYVISIILPYLAVFDLRAETVYSTIRLAGSQQFDLPNMISQTQIWKYVGIAVAYGIMYVSLALAAGMLLFQTRELGGAEG